MGVFYFFKGLNRCYWVSRR